MRSILPGSLVALALATVSLHAQSTVPTLSVPFPSQALSPGGPAVTIDVRNHIIVPGVVGTQFARFNTVLGAFSVELRNDVAPRHVANFLAYAQSNAYANSFIHRAVSFDGGAVSIVQGGGYRAPVPVTEIPKIAPIPLEYNLANAPGTLAAARTSDVNSATSEWFFNVRDNSTNLGPNNGGGYTVFGRVLGTGMTVVNAMAAVPRGNFGGPFTDLPVRNYTAGNPTESNLLLVNSITPATLFPTGGGASVLEITVQNPAPTIVSSTLSGSTLTMAPVSPGTASITVRVIDTNGNAATSTFTVSVSGTAPVFTAQPMTQTAAADSTVVFNAPAIGAASYRWERNGVAIEGATSGTLVLKNVTTAEAGSYVSFAINSLAPAGVASDTATLTVVNTPPTQVGRLINLSILTVAGSGPRILTMGAVIGPGDRTTPLPLVIRAVGPTLRSPPFNVDGVLPDPVMTFFAQGNPTPIADNDNWGGSPEMSTAFAQVAAFALPPGSLDSAMVRTPGVLPGGYTVQVTGKQDASGLVIAEIYEGAGVERTAASPRLINLSTLAQIDAGADLAVGFVIGGQTARTVLVRGVGPSLVPFEIDGFMVDPQLELFNNDTGVRIAANDNWNASLEISSTAARISAFSLVGPLSKDAVLLVTLPPGAYSARVSGVGGTGGTAIVEVYEVP